MNETSELVRIDSKQSAISGQWRSATDVAGVVREFALQRTITIQNKKYPPVVVWQAIANAFGCVASARDVKTIDGGVSAIGEVKRMSDGMVIAEGEGFVGDDEKTWASRPMFARRAMAQTRAIGRACRAAFAFVVPLIDAGLQTTPAEEMEFLGEDTRQTPQRPQARPAVVDEIKAKLKQTLGVETVTVEPVQDEPPPHDDSDAPAQGSTDHPERNQSTLIRLPKNKGKHLDEVNDSDLKFILKLYRQGVAKEDPKWHAINLKRLEAAELEASRRGLIED